MIIKYNILRSSQSSMEFYCLMESNNNKILHSKIHDFYKFICYFSITALAKNSFLSLANIF